MTLLPLAALAACAFQNPPQAARPVATPFRPSGIYRRGERAGWTVTLPEGAAPGPYRYALRRNNKDEIRSGELDLSSGSATVETVERDPAMLFLEIRGATGRPRTFGAAVDPRGLKPVVPRPRDFDAFWKGKLAALRAIPERPVLSAGTSYKPEVEYATLQMDHVNGTHVYGQIARPKAPGKRPAVLVLQWASPPYPLQKSWVVELAAKGWLALNVEPHDVVPNGTPAYYQSLPLDLKNYASTGRDDRDRSSFVEMALRDVRAVDYLSKQPDWDGKTLVVMGTSMGGQQSFYAAGLCPQVTHMIVNEPAGADMNAGLRGRQQGYPFFDVREPRTMEAARYVDPINFAPRIRATSLVAMGFTDDVAPPAGIWTAFNLIKGPKEAAPMVDSPHNNTATPEQQRPYTQRAAEWLDALVHGRKVEPRR